MSDQPRESTTTPTCPKCGAGVGQHCVDIHGMQSGEMHLARRVEAVRRKAVEAAANEYVERRYSGLPFPVLVPVCGHCGAADEIGPDNDCHACGLSQADNMVDPGDSPDA